jgi:membrane peptidoglycan carboxypeptidase
MNFSKIVDDDYVPAAALGGLTNGVSTVEMASAYATLANDGKFRNPTCIKKITDYDGNVVVNMKKITKEKQIYTQAAAEAMTDILEGVLVRGTAAGKQLSNMACAGKTGTTSDKKDGWFCGYTPYYTTAVWVGYDTPREVSNLYGSTYPLYIWHQFMEELHSGMEYTSFTYDSITSDDTYSSYDSDTDYDTTATEAPEETVEPDAMETDQEDTQDGDITGDEEETGEGNGKTPKATQSAGQNKDKNSQKPSNNNSSNNGDEYEDVGEETTVEDVGESTE